ncbi:MAG: ferritin-like domain-containing protein [Myxococcota bacterium]|nr:ferritin-like domain-containing protein [Myxococcota bacterium]
MPNIEPGYDFGDARFDLADARDREIVRFILSQALFGEATGVYCGKSLYQARSLEAARFYLRQARQELNHLEHFAEIFRLLEMEPEPGHWVIRLMSSHNNYYPLKVLMEHAIGEGMVLDIFKDVLLQTLPDDHPGVDKVKKRLRAIAMEEVEHVEWGEKETRYNLEKSPWLKWPYYGLLELQLLVAPLILKPYQRESEGHPVLSHLPAFVDHVSQRVWKQGQDMGFVPAERPGLLTRLFAMTAGALLFLRSQVAKADSTLDKTYLSELGFSR